MTHRVIMNADNIFLGLAKKALEDMENNGDNFEEELMMGVNVVITCVTAIEAFTNKVFIKHLHFKCYDDLKLISKIASIHDLKNSAINWGINPYQTFKRLVTVRNWLIHFKNTNIGLLGADNTWTKDPLLGNNNQPKIDPFTDLNRRSCREYYTECRNLIIDLGKVANLPYQDYEFAINEKYEYFQVG